MWPVLEEIAEEKDGLKLFQDDYSSEKCSAIAREFLGRHGLWMLDVLNTYERKPRRVMSAADTDIVPPKKKNFLEFRTVFASCLSLRMVVFTSQQAARWTFNALFEQQLAEKFSVSKALETWRSSPKQGSVYATPIATFSVFETNVSFFILPSPSSASPEPYHSKKAVYRTVLFEIPQSKGY